MNEEGIRYAVSYDNEKNEIIVPGDCYENKVNIKSTYGGFRVTTQNIEKTNVFESLYLNF
jgi:hypothetical protein